MSNEYLHGYTLQEQERLQNQANFLESRIFEKIELRDHFSLLEVGCGVGAQTEILLKRFPQLKITAVDIHPGQLNAAQERLSEESKRHQVQFVLAAAEKLPFESQTFDSAFLCWFLEHVSDPLRVLKESFRLLKTGGVLYATEVMNSSFYLYPQKPAIESYWKAYNELQIRMGGNPNVGSQLGNLLSQSGFSEIQVYPLFFLEDQRDSLKLSRTLDYWRDLLLSGLDSLIRLKLIETGIERKIQKEIEELKTFSQTVFCYTSIQGRGIRKV